MLYRETVTQAQLLAYADDFWLLALMFAAVPLLLPFMRRIRLVAATRRGARRAGAPKGHRRRSLARRPRSHVDMAPGGADTWT